MATAREAAGFGALTLFVPSNENSGWSSVAQIVAQCLREEQSPVSILHDPRGPDGGLQRFAEEFSGNAHGLLVSGFGAIGTNLLARQPISLADFAPVARLTSEYLVCATRPDSPVTSLTELVAALRDSPKAVELCGAPPGSADHLLACQMAHQAGVAIADLNYRAFSGGVGAIDAALNGRATYAIAGVSEVQARLALGELRALAISAPQRVPGIGASTFVEQGVNVELSNWRGLFAPRGITPTELDRLVALTQQLTLMPQWQAALFRYNWMSDYLAGPAFGRFVTTEIARVRLMLAEFGL